MDERFVGRWRMVAVASREGDLGASDPPFTVGDQEVSAFTFVLRADGTGLILRGQSPQPPYLQAIGWRVEDDGGRLFLTVSVDGGEASQRVWLDP